jgi:hypothetical protein
MLELVKQAQNKVKLKKCNGVYELPAEVMAIQRAEVVDVQPEVMDVVSYKGERLQACSGLPPAPLGTRSRGDETSAHTLGTRSRGDEYASLGTGSRGDEKKAISADVAAKKLTAIPTYLSSCRPAIALAREHGAGGGREEKGKWEDK